MGTRLPAPPARCPVGASRALRGGVVEYCQRAEGPDGARVREVRGAGHVSGEERYAQRLLGGEGDGTGDN